LSNPALLDPVVVARLGNLELRARRILDGLYSGQHANIVRGHSQDFSEHRPYNPGDDPKGLDWKIFGRTDRLVIRQYEEQTNIGAVVILDDSASMRFSAAGRLSKLDYAKTLAAALGYLVTRQGDAIGLVSRQAAIPSSSARGQLERFFGALEKDSPEGIWKMSDLSGRLGHPLKKRGFAIVLSDLMEDTETVLSSLRSLAARKHEVIVIHLADPAERELPFEGPVIFTDAETGERLETNADAIRAAYQSAWDAKRHQLSQALSGAGIDYLYLTTDTPFDKGLGAFLTWRAART
jgi:uncharacterized protein (DUF58 family)